MCRDSKNSVGSRQEQFQVENHQRIIQLVEQVVFGADTFLKPSTEILI